MKDNLTLVDRSLNRTRRSLRFTVALLLASLLAASCALSPLSKHATAFSLATVTVVNSSEDAYRAAIKLRHDEQISAAVYDYDKNPKWNPYNDPKPLLTPDQLDARIKVLDGLKAYAQTLVELTGKPSSKDASALDTAAAGVGTNLRTLNQGLASKFPGVPVMGATTANGVSTAVLALGDYLIARKVKGSLPKVTQEMNAHVVVLCELLNSDIDILRRQADVDYQSLLVAEDDFIRKKGTALDPIQHRDEVGKLIDVAAQQKANDELLAKLQKSLHTLALTHQALAAAAQGNDAESIKQKIADLEAAGQDLGTFYQSLPTK